MSGQPTQKAESHITTLPREIDQNLAIALGEMVVAFGRLEDMFKVAIKRLEKKRTLEEVIKAFSGGSGTLGKLLDHCSRNFPSLKDSCDKAVTLNTHRQDFIHATFAATEQGDYVRFRKLVGYDNLSTDIQQLRAITNNTNSLIEELDQKTGPSLTNLPQSDQNIATVSAPRSRI